MVEDKDERLEGGKAEGLEGEGLKVEGPEGEGEKAEGAVAAEVAEPFSAADSDGDENHWKSSETSIQ